MCKTESYVQDRVLCCSYYYLYVNHHNNSCNLLNSYLVLGTLLELLHTVLNLTVYPIFIPILQMSKLEIRGEGK